MFSIHCLQYIVAGVLNRNIQIRQYLSFGSYCFNQFITDMGREFAVSGLRAIKAEEGLVIPASHLGKIKTVTQIVAVVLIILQSSYQPFINLPLGSWALYVAMVITVWSGIEYFKNFAIRSPI